MKGGERAVRTRNNKPQQSFTRTGQHRTVLGWDGTDRRGEDVQALRGARGRFRGRHSRVCEGGIGVQG